MKKFFGTMAVAAALFAGYSTFEVQKSHELTDIVLTNVEALAVGEPESEKVKCYCKTNIFSPNVCVVGGSGGYCGSDPCTNHDGNCR